MLPTAVLFVVVFSPVSVADLAARINFDLNFLMLRWEPHSLQKESGFLTRCGRGGTGLSVAVMSVVTVRSCPRCIIQRIAKSSEA